MARMLKSLFGASSTAQDSHDFFRSMRYNELYDLYNDDDDETGEEGRHPASAHSSSDHRIQVTLSDSLLHPHFSILPLFLIDHSKSQFFFVLRHTILMCLIFAVSED